MANTAKILKFKGDYSGLDSRVAEDNLLFYGHNSEVKQEEPRKIRFYGVFRHLRLYLMLLATVLYYLGDMVTQGSLLMLLTLGYCAFEILMENHCDRKVRELTSATGVAVRVVRDGVIVLAKSEKIVQDDLIILQGGESVPADAHILEAQEVTVDESIFTSSSNPVKKYPGSDGKHELKQSCVYKGTKVLSGILIARVFATGQDVKIRPKVKSAREYHSTEFELLINKVSTLFTYGAAVLLTLVAFLRLLSLGTIVGTLEEGDSLLVLITAAVIPAVSFGLCAIPVSLSKIVRFYYVNGASKLAGKYGEIKNLRALEALNSVTVVCIGKDTVVDCCNTPLVAENADNKEMLMRIAALSCTPSISPDNSYERAIYVSSAFKHIDVRELHENTLVQRYVPEKEGNYNKINGNLWDINGSRLLCIKGAPDVILSLCNMTADKLAEAKRIHSQYEQEGHCVFAVAFAKIPKKRKIYEEDGVEYVEEIDCVPENVAETKYSYMGLLAFSSGVKDNIPAAVKACYRAGVKVVMFTPDNKEAALAVAEKIGLQPDVGSAGLSQSRRSCIITGEELERAKSEGVVLGCGGVNIYAEVTTEQKADIISLLRATGEKTAVFGGNCPSCSNTDALELADVRIAVARHTTDREWDNGMDTMSQFTTGTACEACDFIMEGDGFIKAADTFREARQMHRNIKRCISAAISTFLVVFLFAFVNLLVDGGSFVLEAVLISTVTVLIVPALTLIFSDNDLDLRSHMQPSPFIGRGKINRSFLIAAGIQGLSMFAAALALYLIFRTVEGYTVEKLRAIFFNLFTAGGIAMTWVGLSCSKPFWRSLRRRGSVLRDWRNNPAIVISVGLLLFAVLMTYLPFFNSSFGLGAVNPLVLLLSVVVGAVSQLWFDFVKKRFNENL
jgi:Ca2+-transporting ATPase